MSDIKNGPVLEVDVDVNGNGEPETRRVVLTIDVNQETGGYILGARDVTYDPDFQDSPAEDEEVSLGGTEDDVTPESTAGFQGFTTTRSED